MKAPLALLILSACLGCAERSARDDYDDFRTRTATFREDDCAERATTQGQVVDISGVWVIRALLNGGIALGLRVELVPSAEEPATPPRKFDASFWLENQPFDSPPLLTTPTEIGEDGSFELVASPLNLGPDVLSSETTVIASVRLQAVIQNSHAFCGVAQGMATSPLELDLSGSTFGARRWMEGLALEDVPFRCPGDPCAPDATVGPMDGGPTDAGVLRPQSPDFSVESVRSDLTGDWFMTASLSGLPLRLWIALVYREAGAEASVDGTLRLVTDSVDSPGLATFSASVDASGRFEIWLPALSLEVNGLSIEGDVLLSAATIAEGWCGVADGQVRSPVTLDLSGSTFGALRWAPGPEEPADTFNACP